MCQQWPAHHSQSERWVVCVCVCAAPSITASCLNGICSNYSEKTLMIEFSVCVDLQVFIWSTLTHSCVLHIRADCFNDTLISHTHTHTCPLPQARFTLWCLHRAWVGSRTEMRCDLCRLTHWHCVHIHSLLADWRVRGRLWFPGVTSGRFKVVSGRCLKIKDIRRLIGNSDISQIFQAFQEEGDFREMIISWVHLSWFKDHFYVWYKTMGISVDSNR